MPAAAATLDARPARARLTGLAVLGLLAAALGLLATLSHSGDYVPGETAWVGDNPAPAIEALAHGRLGDFLGLHPWMGSVSLLLRWPFAALGEALGASDLAVYKLGAVPCLLVLGGLALIADRLLAARGRRPAIRVLVAALWLVNPVTFAALRAGHPEELLTAALCLGAVLAAGRGRAGWAGVLLGLALATKQWALVAVLAVLAAHGDGRGRLCLTAAVVAAALTLPLALGNPGRLWEVAREASRPTAAGPANVWAPFVEERRRVFFDGERRRTAVGYTLPDGLRPVPRPIILLAPVAIGLLWLRRHPPGLDGAVGLLALFLLLRCALDPVNFEYYYAPFVIVLALYETLRRDELPIVSLLASAAIWLTFEHLDTRPAITAAWAAWTVPLAAGLAVSLFRREPAR
jgi:hypothetical protein